MSFQDTFDKIRDGIGDLTQLNVRTFTGEIKATAANVPVDPDKQLTLGEFLAKAQANGELQVVGFTDMKIDGDIDQFITSGNFPIAVAAHNSAIQTGQQSRKAMFDLFSDAIKKGIETVSGT